MALDKISFLEKAVEAAWEEASTNGTVEAFERFLARFPLAAHDAEAETGAWDAPSIDPGRPFVDAARGIASGLMSQNFEGVSVQGELRGTCSAYLDDGRSLGCVHVVGEFLVLVPSSEAETQRILRYEGELVYYVLKEQIGTISEPPGPTGQVYVAEGLTIRFLEIHEGRLTQMSASDGSYVNWGLSLVVAEAGKEQGYRFVGRRPSTRQQ